MIEIQQKSIKYARRGLYANRNIQAGEILKISDVVPLRPLLDFMPANNLDEFIGSKSLIDINKGSGIKIEDLTK